MALKGVEQSNILDEVTLVIFGKMHTIRGYLGSIAITGDNCRFLETLKGYYRWRIVIAVHNVFWVQHNVDYLLSHN